MNSAQQQNGNNLRRDGLNRPMKVLILRFSSIGDIVLTTPVIRCLKKQYPDCEIHYFTKSQYRVVLEQNPYIDKLWFLKKGLKEVIREMKEENFDYVIDLHNNLRTRAVKWLLGVKSFSFPKLNLEKFLYVNLKINRMPKVHIVDRYLAAVEGLGVANDGMGLDYFISEGDEVALDSLPDTHRNGYIAYAIGGQHMTKKLPLDRMVELCEKIDYPIVLLGGKEDVMTGEQVRSQVGESRIVNACGKFTLNQSASLVRQSRVVFTHDTGLMHIAAAYKKRVYSIWGNTTPDLGMYPYLTSFEIIENKGLICRPCSKIGYERCPKGHFKCMKELVFEFDLVNDPVFAIR